jgi:two-component system cell cycle response regulator
MSPEEKTPAMPHPSTADEPRVPHLVVVSGPNVGSAYRLTAPDAIIGRDEGADISLPHPSISRRHARLTVTAEGVFVEDLDSTNGTFVGVAPVKGRAAVQEGDNIGLGTYTILKLTRSVAAGAALRRAVAGKTIKIESREYLLDLLRAEHAHARKHNTPLTLVFVRADAVSGLLFKGSDTLVDEAMGVVGAELDAAIRTEAFLTRSSDDEFAILVRGGGDAAAVLAERIRARVESRAALPGSALAFHTVTAVVLPLRPTTLEAGHGIGRSPITAEEIRTTAQALAGPPMVVRPNCVVRLQPFAI